MDGHAGWLIYSRDIVIFIKDLETERLGKCVERRTRLVFNPKLFSAPQTVAGLERGGIRDPHLARAQQFLNTRAA
jgi:hypothetical protein